MKKFTTSIVAGLALLAGCVDSPYTTNANSPDVTSLNGALTKAGLQTLADGVLAQDRALSREFAQIVEPEIFARDAYRIDPNEQRFVIETLGGTPDPGSFSGSGGWTNGYVAIRAATSLLDALPGADPTSLTAGQVNTTRGLIQTFKALDYYRLEQLRDSIGVAIQTSDPSFVAPLSCKKNVLDYIAALLDSANTA